MRAGRVPQPKLDSHTIDSDYEPSVTPYYADDPIEGADPLPGQRSHSGLGIASFVIALLIGGIDLFVIMVTVANATGSRHRNTAELAWNLASGGVLLACVNFMSIPLCLIGVGLAIAAFVSQPRANHLFTWIGSIGNGMVLLSVVAFLMIGSMRR